ncbi:hypothetical protein [Acidimangrovimonas pyrenivorans]|uniref:Uncharacterized protein n=1 Tax=Acidimangrovimonas pyrenivorans TaxID=2030798 RepID=A0ABV7AIY2_9RHOB
MSTLARLWRHHRLSLVAFVLAAGLTLFFAIRMAVFSVYWSDPAHHNQVPQGWMTPRYVARSWQVPPETVTAVTGPLQAKGHPMTLEQIADAQGVPLTDLIARIEAALAAEKASRQAGRP